MKPGRRVHFYATGMDLDVIAGIKVIKPHWKVSFMIREGLMLLAQSLEPTSSMQRPPKRVEYNVDPSSLVSPVQKARSTGKMSF